MGNAVIWYTPSADTGGRTVEIDLGGRFTDREGPSPVCFKSSAEGMNGARVITWMGGRNRQTFRRIWDPRAGGDGQGIRRKLWGLVNHLARGGTCNVAEDVSFAWAGFASSIPQFNSSKVDVGRNKFYPMISTGLSISPSGREVLIQSDCDSYLTEMKLVSSVTVGVGGAILTLGAPLLFDYASEARWLMVREYGSYLAQRLPDDVDPASILHHDRENNWSLELPLEDDPARLDKMGALELDGDGGVIVGGNDPTGGINPSPDEPGSILTDGSTSSYQPNTGGGWWIP